MKNTTAMRIRLDVTQPDDSAWNKRDKVYIAVEEVGGEGGGSGNRGKAAQGNIHESIPQGKNRARRKKQGCRGHRLGWRTIANYRVRSLGCSGVEAVFGER